MTGGDIIWAIVPNRFLPNKIYRAIHMRVESYEKEFRVI
jgi:hypothetical protein